MNTLRKQYNDFRDEVVKRLIETLGKLGSNVNEHTPGFDFYKFNQLSEFSYMVELTTAGTIIYFMDNVDLDWDDPKKPVKKIKLADFIRDETVEAVSYFPLSRAIELLDALDALVTVNKQEDMGQLEAQLQAALESEDYPRCAAIRDQMKKLQPA